MNILHLSTAMSWRGGEQQVAYLMEELGKQGIRQAVFCPMGSVLEAHCRQLGIQTFAFKRTFNLDPFLAMRIRFICRNEGVTHLHAHDSPSHTFAVLASAIWGLNLPIFVHRRVDFPVGKNRLSNWKYNHPSIRRIICVSDFIKQTISPEIRRPEKLAVVHSGIDLTRFPN